MKVLRYLCAMFDVRNYLEIKRAQVNEYLERCLPPETERPFLLHRAMRYSVLGGGKRLRPILCLASAEACGGSADAAMLSAAALECLHAYTLIHDDLPSMDNDDLRRGRPTVHKVFGEANAILAGDSLHTLAFELLAQSQRGDRLVLELARAAGSRGVAAGQFEDLAAEGQAPDAEWIRFIHVHKTARLIRAACRMGGIAVGAKDAELDALAEYGELIGIAFQAIDDILNATSTAEMLGKAVGSDAARNKMTYVAFMGVDRARTAAEELVQSAVERLSSFDGAAEPLRAVARYIVDRKT